MANTWISLREAAPPSHLYVHLTEIRPVIVLNAISSNRLLSPEVHSQLESASAEMGVENSRENEVRSSGRSSHSHARRQILPKIPPR